MRIHVHVHVHYTINRPDLEISIIVVQTQWVGSPRAKRHKMLRHVFYTENKLRHVLHTENKPPQEGCWGSQG